MKPYEPLGSARLSSLLSAFLEKPLSELQLQQISQHLELLLRWNSRMNLTSVRKPEDMATRHFGESLFAGGILAGLLNGRSPVPGVRLLDVGSGAGFPGLPIKVLLPELVVTLAESQHKKATFLKEVVRTVGLTGVSVFQGRAETLREVFNVLTVRAVDHPQEILGAASNLLEDDGILLLMLGRERTAEIQHQLPGFLWQTPVPIPGTESSFVLAGVRNTTALPR